MALCEELPHLEMYYIDEGSRLERCIGVSFRTILKSFSRVKVLSRESNQDLWNAIVNETVAKVDRADCDSRKARYSLTMKLLMAEFKKKEKPVWIMRKKM